MKNKVVLIDYSSFKKDDMCYKNSITELLDFLLKQNVEIYALIETDSLNIVPVLEPCIYGLIPFAINDLYQNPGILINDIQKKTRKYNNNDILVISDDLLLIGLLSEQNFETCFIEPNYISELTKVYKKNKITKKASFR